MIVHHFLAEPRPSGLAAGVLPDLEGMLPLYYDLWGWDATVDFAKLYTALNQYRFDAFLSSLFSVKAQLVI